MKVIKLLIISILILSVILGIKIYLSNNVNETTGELKEKVNIEAILNKAYSVTNYKYTADFVEMLRKGNIVKEYSKNSDTIYIYDYDKMMKYSYKDNGNTLIRMPISDESNIRVPHVYLAPIDSIIKNSIFEKRETINGKETILIKNLNPDNKELEFIYYNFDVDTGFPIRSKSKKKNGEIIEQDYKFEFNTVSDDEIKLPDLNKYKIIDNTK